MLFRNWQFSAELCTLYAEERFDIAHIRVLGKKLLTEGEVGRHVGRCDDQNEVEVQEIHASIAVPRARQRLCARIAARPCCLAGPVGLYNDLQALTSQLGQLLAAQDDDLFLDQSKLLQALDAAPRQVGADRCSNWARA